MDLLRDRRHLLVTGAQGAIGRHVVKMAFDRGRVVSGLGHADRQVSSTPVVEQWYESDVNVAALQRMVGGRGGGIDDVIHLAGGSLVGASIDRPADDFQRTVIATQQLLEWARLHAPQARLVIVSSAGVYGDGYPEPIREDAALQPLSPYGAHKAMCETMAIAYARQFGLNVAIVRLFSVYGPGLRKQLVWEISDRLLRGDRAISLGGTGSERRDFLYISDAAAMLLTALELANENAPILNGCSGEGTSIATLCDMIAEGFENVTFNFSGQSRTGDPHSLVGDPGTALAAGLVPSTELRHGLAQTKAWIMGDRGGIV